MEAEDLHSSGHVVLPPVNLANPDDPFLIFNHISNSVSEKSVRFSSTEN